MSKETMKRKADVPTDVLKAELEAQAEEKKIKRVAGQAIGQRSESGKNLD